MSLPAMAKHKPQTGALPPPRSALACDFARNNRKGETMPDNIEANIMHQPVDKPTPLKKKHTPGPWRVSDLPKAPYLIYAADNYAVCDCKVYHRKHVINADMQLIAAAPELLEALELAISKDMLSGETRDTAVKAIAKATGK